jgi:hypothetical protein
MSDDPTSRVLSRKQAMTWLARLGFLLSTLAGAFLLEPVFGRGYGAAVTALVLILGVGIVRGILQFKSGEAVWLVVPAACVFLLWVILADRLGRPGDWAVAINEARAERVASQYRSRLLEYVRQHDVKDFTIGIRHVKGWTGFVVTVPAATSDNDFRLLAKDAETLGIPFPIAWEFAGDYYRGLDVLKRQRDAERVLKGN